MRLLARRGYAPRPALAASGLDEPHCPTSRIRALGGRQSFAARHQTEDSVDRGGLPVRFRGVLASDDGRPREDRRAWRPSAQTRFCPPY